MKTIPFIKTDSFYKNIEKYGYNHNTCACCGKPLKGIKYMVQTIEGPDVIPADVTQEQLDEAGLVSQGAYQIGGSCIKKYPKAYRISL